MMPPVKFGEILGNYVIVINETDFVLLAIWIGVLIVAVPWLANLRQPAPHPNNWRLANEKWKYLR